MNSLTHLNSLQALEAGIRCGSLKVAADELGITPAAVGQRIRTLEEYLGIELIHRNRSGITPTSSLEAVLDKLNLGFAQLGEVAEILRFPNMNTIRVSAPSDWLALWLKPRLSRFEKQFPHIEVTTFADEDASENPVDLAISYGNAEESPSAIKLFDDYQAPVISETNSYRIEQEPEATCLEGFPLLHMDTYDDAQGALSWQDWVDAYGHRQSEAERGMRFKKLLPALKVIKSDAGILLGGISLILDGIASGELKLPFSVNKGTWLNNSYLVTPATPQKQRIQLQEFTDWLTSESSKTQAALEILVNEKNGVADRA